MKTTLAEKTCPASKLAEQSRIFLFFYLFGNIEHNLVLDISNESPAPIASTHERESSPSETEVDRRLTAISSLDCAADVR